MDNWYLNGYHLFLLKLWRRVCEAEMNHQKLKIIALPAVVGISLLLGGVVATADSDPNSSNPPARGAEPLVQDGWGSPSAERAEVDRALAACLEDAGADAHVIAGVQGGVAWNSDLTEGEERDLYQTCHRSLLADGLIEEHPPMSEVELREFYAYQLKLADCLTDLGLKIGTPPTEEQFVTSGGLWSPYDDVYPYVTGLPQWDQLQAACPQRNS